MPDLLYHFTCRDGHKRIGRYNCVLMPQAAMWPYVWLTTEAVPDFEATGLTRLILRCDRTEFRYVVTDIGACKPWLGSPHREAIPADRLSVLEEYGDAEHWWIAPGPVRATWDRSWVREGADVTT